MLRQLFLLSRPSAIILLSLAASFATAQGTTSLPRNWHKIADLPPGTPIIVQQTGSHRLTSCLLDWIDNHAIACSTFDAQGNTQRVIFPTTATKSVERDSALDNGPHTNAGIFVGMAAGGLLGGLMLARSGVGAGFFGAGLGAAAGGGFAMSVSDGVDHSPRPQWSIQLHRPQRAFFHH